MELKAMHCNICGGTLKIKSGGIYQCEYNPTHIFKDEAVNRNKESMLSLLGEALYKQKEEQIANIRANLYEAVHEEFINSKKVIGYCRELKNLLPEDFAATFYELANTGSPSQINKFLDGIDTEKQAAYLDDVIEFMIKSLESSNVSHLKALIERAYKGEKRTYYITRVEDEAEKLDNGIYEPTVPRDVFIAYSSLDTDKVNEIVEFLESENISCFVSLRNMRHGKGAVENYRNVIEKAIHNCKCVVFVSSDNSRSLACDALKIELPYIKECEPKMGRIEYLIEDYGKKTGQAARKILKDFFKDLEYCRTKEDLISRLLKYVTWTKGKREDQSENKEKSKEEKEKKKERKANEKAQKKERKAQLRKQKKERKAQLRKQKKEQARVKAAYREDFLNKLGVVFGIISPVVLLGFGLFNFIFPYTNTIVFPSYNGTVWGVIAILLLAIAVISVIVGIVILVKSNDSGLLIWIIPVAVLAVGIFLLIGGLSHAMYGWGIAFAVVGGVGGFIGWCLLTGISDDSAFGSILIILSAYVIGLTFCGGLYTLQKDIKVYDDSLYYQVREDNTLTVFVDNYDMEALEIPSSIDGYTVTSIGTPIHGGKRESLKQITLPQTLLYIDSYAFANCKDLTSIDIPDGVISIGDGAFQNCENLTLMTIPDSVVTIYGNAFNNCGLLEADIPDSVKEIYDGAFENCRKMTKVSLSGNLTYIHKRLFKGCSALKEVILPDSVEEIDQYAFENCIGLTKIVIPERMKQVWADAFKGCSGLLTIYCRADEPNGWSSFWKFNGISQSGYTVVWGYKDDD